MNIDYNEIHRQSKREKISPFLIIKRKLNYRETVRDQIGCKFCKHLNYMEYKDSLTKKTNCHIIGESSDYHAQIDYNYKCDAWESINK